VVTSACPTSGLTIANSAVAAAIERRARLWIFAPRMVALLGRDKRSHQYPGNVHHGTIRSLRNLFVELALVPGRPIRALVTLTCVALGLLGLRELLLLALEQPRLFLALVTIGSAGFRTVALHGV